MTASDWLYWKISFPVKVLKILALDYYYLCKNNFIDTTYYNHQSWLWICYQNKNICIQAVIINPTVKIRTNINPWATNQSILSKTFTIFYWRLIKFLPINQHNIISKQCTSEKNSWWFFNERICLTFIHFKIHTLLLANWLESSHLDLVSLDKVYEPVDLKTKHMKVK